MNGFRRGDEMNVCIASLIKLLEPKQEQFLYVIQRGIMHEVLRVQISADFRTSAWIACEGGIPCFLLLRFLLQKSMHAIINEATFSFILGR